ncbi:DUF1198 family protein [Erwinia psidii]|uniref:DUF1198 domain-containing protein n=1 Tax=Erwinia psidii TaxID=69224 RepID=A0A3N6RWT4_9GAMM|nr:DUF1198 family protein [Erwinia psidii]MCX8957083.1 DUF1198 domain-containing protein [Erwinia psidii]MCX8961735.1 DUF1198 domain-containing protein [Erwinia psidii]MCX8965329.1 DUF1198 domain-containing protein [Erwinia psidii]RQM37538.1 DUF1198 domain-containing protein [Erwinia psidii]
MIWLMLLTLVVVFMVGFRVLNSQTRRASKALTRRLNIDPVYVESLIALMGRSAGEEFVAYIGRDNEAHLSNAAMVLLIYQVFIVDESDEGLSFWRGVLRKAYLPTEMSGEHVRLALVFLRDLEPDPQEMHTFRLRYHNQFSSPEDISATGASNVYSIHSRLQRHQKIRD